LAVYLSSRWRNLSCVPCGNIFFDKLNVEVSKGNLLEETHYYPHGLPIKPLSSVQAPTGGYRDNRRKYQGNEYIQDLGLNWMSFGARQYDPQIGRFLSVDPLADASGQQIFSPYAAMGNAPESMVDPNGEKFTFATAGLEAAFEKLRQQNLEKIEEYNKELKGLDLIGGSAQVQARGASLIALIAMHKAFNKQLDAMEGDQDVEFHLSNETPFDGAAGSTFYNFNEGRVQFNFGGDDPWLPTLAHELRHGYGLLIGEWAPAEKYDDVLYDIQDEKEGNKTGLLFTSHPEDAVNGVYDSQNWDAATGPEGKYGRAKGKYEQLSINSSLTTLSKYSNDKTLTNPVNPNPNMTVGDVYFRINENLIKNGQKPRYRFGKYLKK
ncbi:RHS repeat domain-containing protein, partial [Taibaiella koreensis]|uniref:RHS repeat domain-containing protein n=1 Tax=Taibaiella koreensis TaxID=1268548 RepID=UPI00293909CF